MVKKHQWIEMIDEIKSQWYDNNIEVNKKLRCLEIRIEELERTRRYHHGKIEDLQRELSKLENNIDNMQDKNNEECCCDCHEK